MTIVFIMPNRPMTTAMAEVSQAIALAIWSSGRLSRCSRIGSAWMFGMSAWISSRISFIRFLPSGVKMML